MDALLLYTSIFFLVSVMEDLGQQNTIMYVEGSSSMESEKKRLKIIMILFGTAYILRAGFNLTFAIYMNQFLQICEDYPGFFEIAQSIYFIIADVIPILSFFRMHDQVYGQNEGQQQQIQMQVNPDAARAYHLQNNNQ